MRCLTTSQPSLSSNRCMKYLCDRVNELSSVSSTNPSLALFSLTKINPSRRKPAAHRRKKDTKSSSVKCPTHHWIHTASYRSGSGSNPSRGTAKKFLTTCPSARAGAPAPRSASALSMKCRTGSTRSTSSNSWIRKLLVTRPMPAPQSHATRGPRVPARLCSSTSPSVSRRNSAFSFASTEETWPYPPSTPSSVASTVSQ